EQAERAHETDRQAAAHDGPHPEPPARPEMCSPHRSNLAHENLHERVYGTQRNRALRADRVARGGRGVPPLGGSPIEFGVTILPDPPCSRFVELVRLSEDCGFD